MPSVCVYITVCAAWFYKVKYLIKKASWEHWWQESFYSLCNQAGASWF